MVPDGYKGVSLSIEIALDGELPEGRSLVLANTWKGVTALPPGEVVKVEWHPLHGKLQLVSAASDQIPALIEVAEKEHDQRLSAIVSKTVPCAPPFDGVRTVEDTEPYDEIRWHYRVSLSASGCKAELVRTAHLNDGKDLDPPAKPSASAVASSAPTTAPAMSAAPPPPATPPRPASSCSFGGAAAPGTGIAWLALMGLALRRRLRRG